MDPGSLMCRVRRVDQTGQQHNRNSTARDTDLSSLACIVSPEHCHWLGPAKRDEVGGEYGWLRRLIGTNDTGPKREMPRQSGHRDLLVVNRHSRFTCLARAP